ncbi:metal ABC transporter solute-binding protein, Zn/Mn family [Facklamia miroungae]|uniref:Iron/zinc/copper transport system substrate-binding protein n=1 Tax=Facklamia miroungae TaxID=120956 RepID=A0A1G7QKR4_9LACT|nr:zinc ABC transporter substrate-binding protein [Facklamia miroungae]NKZ28951.1 zinc ABC transporter solute-binding protein [Facklamia miroungae]SDF98220.1 iron/zinc/copper transport system substrate-binding protein [Facklamia miroungae]
MKLIKKFITLTLLLATIIPAIGGLETAHAAEDKKLKIVASYSIIADMVRNIVGEHGEVYSLVPIGTDPHSYEPLPGDAQEVSEADLVFYNGFNLETGKGWFDDLLDVTDKKDVAFAVTEEVDPMFLTAEGKENEQDPHAWLDVQNGIKYVELITEKIIEADPEHEADYQENKEKYIISLEELDQYAKDKIAKIPEEQRILVTSEGAFKYFSKAYGFQAAYIWEINTDNQGTPDQMERILNIINEGDVKALFVETSINPKTMETVSHETGIPVKSKIFTDSLAKEGEEGDTYITMIKWNIDHIVNGILETNE